MTLFQRTVAQLGIPENPDLVVRPLPWPPAQGDPVLEFRHDAPQSPPLDA